MKPLTQPQLQQLLAPYRLTPQQVRHLGGGREDSDGVVYAFDRQGVPMALKLMAMAEPEERFADTVAAYEERAKFARYLLDNGAAIVAPEPDEDGLLYRAGRLDNLTYIS